MTHTLRVDFLHCCAEILSCPTGALTNHEGEKTLYIMDYLIASKGFEDSLTLTSRSLGGDPQHSFALRLLRNTLLGCKGMGQMRALPYQSLLRIWPYDLGLSSPLSEEKTSIISLCLPFAGYHTSWFLKVAQ